MHYRESYFSLDIISGNSVWRSVCLFPREIIFYFARSWNFHAPRGFHFHFDQLYRINNRTVCNSHPLFIFDYHFYASFKFFPTELQLSYEFINTELTIKSLSLSLQITWSYFNYYFPKIYTILKSKIFIPNKLHKNWIFSHRRFNERNYLFITPDHYILFVKNQFIFHDDGAKRNHPHFPSQDYCQSKRPRGLGSYSAAFH